MNEQSDRKTEKQHNKEWWKEFNFKCNGCERSCKQSSKVTVVHCPNYVSSKKENEESEAVV